MEGERERGREGGKEGGRVRGRGKFGQETVLVSCLSGILLHNPLPAVAAQPESGTYHRQADVAHLGQVRAFSTQQGFVLLPAFVEEVHSLAVADVQRGRGLRMLGLCGGRLRGFQSGHENARAMLSGDRGVCWEAANGGIRGGGKAVK